MTRKIVLMGNMNRVDFSAEGTRLMSDSSSEPIKVMVVDDQAVTREGIAVLLNTADDIEVVSTADSGMQALKLLSEKSIDLILMDMRMPHMNGAQSTKAILENYPGTRVLVFTTFEDDEYVAEALQAGATGYILKDSEPDEIMAAIRASHQGLSQLAPSVASKVFSRMKISQDSSTDGQSEKILRFMNDREKEILRLVGRGMSNKEISKELNIADGTVRNYISGILQHLNVRDRTQAAIWAQNCLDDLG